MSKGEYDYQTGGMKIDFDFHFIKDGTICELRKGCPRALVGGQGCQCCGLNKGSEMVPGYYDSNLNEVVDTTFYTKCAHPDAQDDKMAYKIKDKYYEELKHQALCALCY